MLSFTLANTAEFSGDHEMNDKSHKTVDCPEFQYKLDHSLISSFLIMQSRKERVSFFYLGAKNHQAKGGAQLSANRLSK